MRNTQNDYLLQVTFYTGRCAVTLKESEGVKTEHRLVYLGKKRLCQDQRRQACSLQTLVVAQ